jgi:photosystem II stability/assembly factor-like uncharacterized protein
MQRFTLFFRLCLVSCIYLVLTFSNISNAQPSANNSFKDTLALPAMRIGGALKLERQPIVAVAIVKKRIIGVGLRGLIVLSDDGGATWRQAQVPVQSDLTALNFPTQQTHGWAVGHDGVILATTDMGETWTKQYDGKMAATALPAYYQKLVEAGDASMQRYLNQTILNAKVPASLPYLGVYFKNEQVGYVVGSFGSILMTQDGGKTWEPLLHQVDNEQFFNLNDIQPIGGTLYIVGERGIIWKLDPMKQHFVSLSTGYRGSFFSIAGHGDTLLAVGLGGTAFRSVDAGATWHQIQLGTSMNLTSISTTADSQRPLIMSQDGEVFIGKADWKTFQALPIKQPMVFASNIAAYTSGRLILVGYSGIKVEQLLPSSPAGKE